MHIREYTIRKNGKNRKNRTRNIENTERKWKEKITEITRYKAVITTKNVRITTSILDTGNVLMINIVFTLTTTIKDISMTITAIGGLGINGIDTQENTHRYTNMEDITAKIHI